MMFTNPYIAGNPVQGQEHFIGRADVLYDVEQTLRNPHANAIVLFGQRRIGKTSVLLQIEQELAAKEEFTPIYFDLQDKAALPLGEVLYQMAQVVAQITQTPLPERRKFDQQGRYFRETFMPQAVQQCHNQGLALLLDEFDVLDMPQREQARVAFFPYLRDWMRVAEGLQFVFVLGRRPEELSTDTLSTFKGIRARRVSLMDQDDTEAIIRQSERNRSVRWNDEAVARVWQWTQGHPYFTQLLCSEVWESAIAPEGFNGFGDDAEENADARELPVVTADDVDAALDGTLDQGANALQWIWTGLPPAERIIMAAMAEASAEQITQEELTETLNRSKVRLILRDLELAPETLISWDLLREVDETSYRFAIPLLRRWVAAEKPLRRVKADLDSIEPLAESLYLSAEGFARMGNIDEAERLLRNALDVNPYHFKARLQLAEVLLAKGDPANAVKELEPAYELEPKYSRTSLVKALLALSDAQENEAEQLATYGRILAIRPDDQIALDKKRTLLLQQAEKAEKKGDIETALQLYQETGEQSKVVELRTDLRKRELAQQVDIARQYEAAEDWTAALAVYDRLLAEFPEEGDWQAKRQAAQAQKQLLETYTRASSAFEQGNNMLAEQLFREIVGVQSDYKEALRYLSLIVKHVDIERLTEENQHFAVRVKTLETRLAQSVKRKVVQVLGGVLAIVIVSAVFASWGLSTLYYQKGYHAGKLAMLTLTPEPTAIMTPTEIPVILPTAAPTKTPAPEPIATNTPVPTTTLLTVRSNVKDDVVFIDGQRQSKPTPLTIELGFGEHLIRVEKEGYAPYEQKIALQDAQTIRAILNPLFTPTPEPEPIPAITLAPGQISCVDAKEGQSCVDPATGMEFVWIPGGTFKMGCLDGDTGCSDDEEPAHNVTLKGFWMGKTEVTQAQWQNVMDENPAYFNESKVGKDWPNHPVEQVSWDDVQKFITELNQKAGKEIYRLPSEAEWEYACRAGTQSIYSFGNDPAQLKNYAWYGENWDTGTTHPVGQKQPNAFGLYDMHGNVWEWCQDIWHDNYDGASDDGSAWLSSRGSYRVLRGGSWYNEPRSVRSAYRSFSAPSNRFNDLGFRLVRTK